MIIKLGER